jgi:hypothetical protein
VADGLSDAEIAQRLGEPGKAIAQEIQGVMAELGFRSRTHAVVYILARQISTTSRDHRPEAPVEHELRDAGTAEGTQEAG